MNTVASGTAVPRELRLNVLDPAKDTQAGNYFISNYPPFSFWTAEQIAAYEKALQKPAPSDTPLGIYIHLPFCRKRCHFCYFRVYTDKNADQIASYLDALDKETSHYAQLPYLSGRKPEFVYFGGGTPSYLSIKQLSQLFENLQKQFPLDECCEIAFEAEPGTLNEKKVHGLRELGITRLSLGFENYDDSILETNGRAHLSKQIFAAYDWALAAGFQHVNIDLIAGMINETEDNWKACVEKTIELAPDSVTIYQMEIPFNTTIYKEMKDEGKITAPVADWPTKRRWVKEAFDRLEQAGYTVTSATTAVKDTVKHQFVYRDELWDGADLLPLGVSSFGGLGGVHVQNEHHWENYLEAVEGGRLPVRRAYQTTADEQLIREFVLQFKLGKLERDKFARKFGVDPYERFADQLSAMREGELIEQTETEVRVPRDALLQIDRALPIFFLPHHQDARYT